MGSRLIDVDKLIDVLRYQPRIGRLARALENKQDTICYDFVDDIGYLVKSYKKRCTAYRKNNCYFLEDTE